MDGNQLVKKARAGDREAFASLYIQYKDSLYRYAYYKLRSAEDAKDAVEDKSAPAVNAAKEDKDSGESAKS